MIGDREELAWAAGLVGGEGCFDFHLLKRWKGTTVLQPRVRLRLSQSSNPFVLRRFQGALGMGRVYGPHKPQPHQKQEKYSYELTRHEYVQAAVAMLWPFLSEVKRNQAAEAIRQFNSFRKIERKVA